MTEEEHEVNQQSNQEDKKDTMDSTFVSRARDEGFWKEMWQQVRLVWYLIRDPEVPIYLKLLPLVAVIYVLVPTDLIPDFFPGLGQLDDLTALIVGAKVFIELSPQHVVSQRIEAMRRRADQREVADSDSDSTTSELEDAIIIDAEYQVVDREQQDQTA